TAMGREIYNGDEDLILLERVLQLQGDFRRRLEPIRVTPLQAAMLLFLSRHEKAKLTDAAATLCVRPPTLTERPFSKAAASHHFLMGDWDDPDRAGHPNSTFPFQG